MTLLTKYAPTIISDFVFEDAHNEVALKAFESGAREGPLLLHGPYGTGKSTLASLIATAGLLRAQSMNMPVILPGIEYKSSSTEYILNCWSLLLNDHVDYPYFIIEDVDHLKGKQTSLRNLMDRKSACGLILTTNEIDNVDGGIKDRCSVYGMKAPSPTQWAPRARAIAASEGLTITLVQAEALLVASGGSIRNYIKALDALRARSAQPVAIGEDAK
jgi:DNA polymerase III delta prime subunit